VTSISNGVAVSSMEAFMTELANSGWLKHVKAVLDTSVAVVQNILEGKSMKVQKFELMIWITISNLNFYERDIFLMEQM
jgi:hypothetical protein